MAHANAPLTPEGRRRLIDRILLDGRPISRVADEAGVSRQRLTGQPCTRSGPRLTHEPIVLLAADRKGQLALNLDPDNNVP